MDFALILVLWKQLSGLGFLWVSFVNIIESFELFPFKTFPVGSQIRKIYCGYST